MSSILDEILEHKRGEVEEALRRVPRSEMALRAIEADPYYMGAYNNLALVYQDRGEMQRALDLYGRALAKAPNNAELVNNVGSWYYAIGDFAEARKLAEMLQALNQMPKPLIGAVQGNAFGGGVGLASVCDVAIGVQGLRMGLTETRLGLIPATIGPYVLARMGRRRLWLLPEHGRDEAVHVVG